jgi:hypothetical protein
MESAEARRCDAASPLCFSIRPASYRMRDNETALQRSTLLMPENNYHSDFYAWANEQAALLRAGDLSAADVQNIAEEIESMGRGEKRELISRLTALPLHLLKRQFQPMMRGRNWRLSIDGQRLDLEDHLKDNPSLKAELEPSIAQAYRRALIEAERETGLARETFPVGRPYASDQMMSSNFWPD